MGQKVFLTLMFPSILFSQVFTEESSKLKFVQILFRHGDRAPVELYPNDPNTEDFWPEGLGQLTELGERQHYALGKFFRNFYKGFFTASPIEVDVFSSGENRCIASAEVNMASFFAPGSGIGLDKTLNWQPIVVHYIPKEKNKYLDIGSYCPRDDAEYKSLVNSPEGQKLIEEHRVMFQNLSFYSGYPITDYVQASKFSDIIYVEQKYNLTIPAWVEPYREELAMAKNMSYYVEFTSLIRQRLRAGPFLELLIKKMKQKTSGALPKLKFQIYSSHDANIAAVLVSLNIFNKLMPPLASAVLFELHEMTNGVNSIRLLYQNSSMPEEQIDPPHTMTLEGCSEFCPLEYFINYTRHLIPENWENECEIDDKF